MSLGDEQFDALKGELERLRENCLYSAQAYFEAAKKAEFWGRLMVFLPALVSAISGFMSAVSPGKPWGAISAVSGSVAATASFLGTTKKASDFLGSARSYTMLRHKIYLELNLLSRDAPVGEMQELARSLNSAYVQIVSSDSPVPNRAFNVARKRIHQGVAS